MNKRRRENMMRTTDRRNNRRKTSGRGPRALARWLLTLAVGLGASGLGETLWAQDRGVGQLPTAPAPVSASAPGRVEFIKGDYWAVLIGIDEYTDDRIADLESPVKDVTAIGEVLQTRYGFASTRIKPLLNANATRKNILKIFYEMQWKTEEADSVFIYYAGHGQYEKLDRVEHGWWVPADAESKDPSSFITNEEVLKYVKGMKARHVYLVADSCFSGSLFGTRRALPPITDRWFAELYKDRSRWGFTSGSNEPVADTGSDGHSPFAYFLLKTLRENQEPYLVPSRIYDRVGPLVTNNAEQKPKSEPLKGAGDHGGQFVFRLTDVAGSSPTVTRPAAPAVTPVSDPAPGPSEKNPENKWKPMLELLDNLLKEKTS